MHRQVLGEYLEVELPGNEMGEGITRRYGQRYRDDAAEIPSISTMAR